MNKKKEYRVNGCYLAKFPDGHYSNEIGTGVTVKALNQKEAQKIAAHKMTSFHGYSAFKWITVTAKETIYGA